MKIYFTLERAQRNYFLIKKSFENLCDEMQQEVDNLELQYKIKEGCLTKEFYEKVDQVSLAHNFKNACQLLTQTENELIEAGRHILLDQAQHIVCIKLFASLFDKAKSSQQERRKLIKIISKL